jgi:hypothetical protein
MRQDEGFQKEFKTQIEAFRKQQIQKQLLLSSLWQ